MKQYKELIRHVLNNGIRKPNRTGIDTIGVHGYMMKFNMDDGFPLVTVKKTFWKSAVAEMLGFLRGYDNAADFRKLGCSVWDANANENQVWLDNPHRKGTDDLGRIYGVQARDWTVQDPRTKILTIIDQLSNVVDDLSQGIDNRREIVTHWNPAELNQMALPPCHVMYQFGIEGKRLNLTMYQRSADIGLGVPFNIAGYSWLLHVIAQITGLTPGTFTHFIHDVHIYMNHVDKLVPVLNLESYPLPKLVINPTIVRLEDLQVQGVDNFAVTNYQHHPAISLSMAI